VSVTLSEVLLSAPELIVILVEERYGEQRIRMKTDSGTQPEERKNGRTEERKNGRTEERKNGRTEERKNGRTEEKIET
jgi:hypothetical protein